MSGTTDWASTVVHLMLTFGASRTAVAKALVSDGITTADRLAGVSTPG